MIICHAFPMAFRNITHHIFCFLITIHKLAKMDFLSFRVLRPESLFFTLGIVGDHTICRVKDILRRTVILLKTDDFCIRKYPLESQNIADISSAEFVDRLVIVTYYAEIFISGCKKAYKLKLCSIRVLILINHDISEPLLISLQYIIAVLKQLNSFYDQIIKIERIISSKCCLIFTINLSCSFLIKICSGTHLHLIRVQKLILRMGNLCQKCTFPDFLCIDVHLAADFFHQGFLVICIIDRKIIIIAKSVDVTSQNTHTCRMESGYPHTASTDVACDPIDTLTHFVCSLICKCDRKYIPRIDSLLRNQICDPVCQYSGLS